MFQNYMAQFELNEDSVVATVMDRNNHFGPVMEGEGSCVNDAVSNALQNIRINFATENDERDACVAAIRSMRLSFRLHEDGRVESLGFI